MDSKTRLADEWQTLQNNHEQYEQSALLIKLTSLILCVLGIAAHVPAAWLGITVALCWLQEGIYKTYQARLAERLLSVECSFGSPSRRRRQCSCTRHGRPTVQADSP